MAIWITEKEIRQLIDMPRAINAVEKAFKALQKGHVSMPQRAGFAVGNSGGGAAMPAWVGGETNSLAVKVVTACPNNPVQFDLPVVMATVLLLDAQNGRLLAVMDGSYLTAVRTGAVSGVATKYLANPQASHLLLFGAGVQGMQQVKAICNVRPVRYIDVVDKNDAKIENLKKIIQAEINIPVRAVSNLQKAVAAADIIATATTASTPLFKGEWLKPGAHINAIGAHAPQSRELDSATVKRAMIIADQREACLAEAGDILLAIRDGAITDDSAIYADLGDVVQGNLKGRTSKDSITCFKSVGLAIQDTAVAAEVYRAARQKKMGQELR